ncbi:MAG: hypothetical protein DMG25_14270 [Acidobacteria bacterium]|nr:MAG: hypothetical protein DMG25_14270 [Acidobacteriota bacterium]
MSRYFGDRYFVDRWVRHLSIFLSRNYNQGFLFGLPTSHAFLQSAQVGSIDLHYPGQPDHTPA